MKVISLWVQINVTICAGARTDIENEFGETALQTAEESLAYKEDSEEKQRYEKVHEDTHTLTHFDITMYQWLLKGILYIFSIQMQIFLCMKILLL